MTSPTLQQAATDPTPPPPGPEPPAPEVEQEQPADDRPPPLPQEDDDKAAPDEVIETGNEGGDPDEAEADLKAFFDAAEVSVTEVKNPPGGSLPF